MKISVCIPVYNFDVRELVFSLKKEIENTSLNVEIILIDDASEEEFIIKNQNLKERVNQFIFLEKNIGRSAIRNLFLKYSSGDYLLFLDCDAKIIHNNFIKKYIDFILENPETEVIYGGRIPTHDKPSDEFLLRWKYATERESLSIDERKKNPYLSFQSNNFIIKKKLFERFIFNQNLNKYGYEDLIFSMKLKNKVKIFHIENYISNSDLESNSSFINKSEEASKNLSIIYNSSDKELISEIKLVRFYEKIKLWKIDKLFLFFFRVNKKLIKKRLLSKNASIRILDVYKLGCFIENV